MKKSLAVLAAIAGLLLAGNALAAKVGDSLYVKAKNTKMMDSSSPTAAVVGVLQPGEQVVWKGSDQKNKRWHKVSHNGKAGVIFLSNLSTKKPNMEMVAGSGGKVDPKAFASSGAATKALGEGAKNYGEKKDMAEAVSELEAVEQIAKNVTETQIAAHADKNGLFPVVGGNNE